MMNHILKSHEIVKTDFVRSEGCYLFDKQGKKYVDFEAGIWCTALGHNHPRVNEAIRLQIEKVMHLGTRFPSMLAEEAAIELLKIAGLPDGKAVFLSSGSEAVEFGVQVIRRITGRPLLLTFSDSYLAAYGSAGQKSSEQWCLLDRRLCDSPAQLDECDAECEHLKAVPFDQIGGFVFEPGSSSGQVRFPQKGLVQALVNRIRQQGGLVAANEITTGMGRIGAWFGYQHYDIQPDIVSVGKGLGNGYPVSVVIMNRDVAEWLENSEFRYAQSHQNDPLGCAVAKEVIQVLRENSLIERSQQVGNYFIRELDRLSERHTAIKEVRGRGLMIALEFDAPQASAPVASLFGELFDRGFIVGCSPALNLLRFQPPLTMPEEEIANLLSALEQIV